MKNYDITQFFIQITMNEILLNLLYTPVPNVYIWGQVSEQPIFIPQSNDHTNISKDFQTVPPKMYPNTDIIP